MPPISCTSKCRWPERALGRLAHGGEGRHQQVVERDAIGQLLAEALRCGLCSSASVRRSISGSSALMASTCGSVGLELAIVGGSEDLGRKSFHTPVTSAVPTRISSTPPKIWICRVCRRSQPRPCTARADPKANSTKGIPNPRQ